MLISITEFIQDLTNPALAFLPKALLVAVLSSIVCGVVGTHVVLRSMAFIGDAVAHAVFPGIAIAFALQGSVLIGGAIAGAIVALLVAVFSQRRRVKEDTLIGIFFAAAFAIGLVVISRVNGYTASLSSFLFGSLTGVSDSQIRIAAGVGVCVIAILAVLHRPLTAVGLDRESARAMNIPVFALDIVLYLAVTAAVVISISTIGNILVLALLVTPAATARILSDNCVTMMLISVLCGILSSFIGLYISWSFDIPTGASIVLTTTVLFILAYILAPRQGLIVRKVRRYA